MGRALRRHFVQIRSFLFCSAVAAIAPLSPVRCGGSTTAGTSAATGPACSSDSTCIRPTPYCGAAHCVECMADANCATGGCDLKSHTCSECMLANRNFCGVRHED